MSNQIKSIYLRDTIIYPNNIDYANNNSLSIKNLYLISLSQITIVGITYIRFIYLGKSGRIYHTTN